MRKANSASTAEVLLAMLLEFDFDDKLPPPWVCTKIDEFSGPGSAHAWQILAAHGECVTYLKAAVDGPRFVEEINGLAETKGILA